MVSSKFHSIEIDWVIYFPSRGNEGRDYRKYGVAYRDRRRSESQLGRRINLEDVMSKPEIQDNYPHTVGYFLHATGKGAEYAPRYLEVRKIESLEGFFKFLRDLNL